MMRYYGVWGLVGAAAVVGACSSNASNDVAPLLGVGTGASRGIGDGEKSGGASGSSGSMAVGVVPSPTEGSSDAPSASGGTTSAASGGGGGSTGGTGAALPPPSEPTDSGGASASGTGGSTGGSGGAGSSGIRASTLTAGAWDDNLNFDFFLAYRQRMDAAGIPSLIPFDLDEYRAAYALHAQTPGPKQTLDVSLVIDTTGSMGDEMAYLQTEFIALSRTIAARHPDSAQRWSLVVYRDDGDAYVTRWFDFRDDSEDFRSHLADQMANGGGDFPEAPDQALEQATQLGWRADERTARLAFWVADAPNHPEKAEEMATAIRDLGSLDVHLYPVASSGIDETTELLLRSAAQMTGGRYLFLTDDSGVGGPHKEPTIPCYFVTKLDDAIVRMVDIELSGTYREPEPAEILRTGGDPSSGRCTLGSGDQVLVY